MRLMIHRLVLAVAIVVAGGGCAGGDEEDPAAASPGRTGQRLVAAVVTGEPTWTPPVIVIIPTATVTTPPTLTAPPTRTPVPTRTVAPSPTTQARVPPGAPSPTAGAGAPTPTPARSSNQGATGGVRATSTPRPPTSTQRPVAPSPTPGPTEDTRLVAQLRRGGLVVYLRHGQTDWGQNDRELAWVPEMLEDRSLLSDCDRQRLLNDEGREQARAIGAAISRLGIPVGPVLSSGWCRTQETARLAFGRVDVVPDRLFDTGYLGSGSSERDHYKAALRSFLSEPVGAGSNRFLVGHGPQIDDAARVVLQEGEAAVFRPEGGGFKLLTRLAPAGWDALDR